MTTQCSRLAGRIIRGPCAHARSPRRADRPIPGRRPREGARAPEFASPEHDRQACGWLGCSKRMKSTCRRLSWRFLCRVCLLERNVRPMQILPLFLCSPAVHLRTPGSFMLKPSTYRSLTAFRRPLARAGPAVLGRSRSPSRRRSPGLIMFSEETSGSRSLSSWREFETSTEDDVEAVIRSTTRRNFGESTERRPLSMARSRRSSATRSRGIHEFHDHPLLPFKRPPAALEGVLHENGGEQRLMPSRPGPDAGGPVLHGRSESDADVAAIRRQALCSEARLRTLPFVPGEMASQRPAGDARGGGAAASAHRPG